DQSSCTVSSYMVSVQPGTDPFVSQHQSRHRVTSGGPASVYLPSRQMYWIGSISAAGQSECGGFHNAFARSWDHRHDTHNHMFFHSVSDGGFGGRSRV